MEIEPSDITELVTQFITNGQRRVIATRHCWSQVEGQFDHLSRVLQVPPFDTYGSTYEIYQLFGGAEKLRPAVDEMEKFLYE